MKKRRLYARFLGLLMCAVMCVGAVPAHAAESTYTDSRYDFSSADTLDAYDQYEKKVSTGEAEHVSPEGTEYVVVYKHNSVHTMQNRPISFYRYGAFLRDNSEEQNFMLHNLEYSSVGTIPQNVLTIYADPEVNFTLTDRSGKQIVSQNGVSMASKVDYYNKTIDNGHMVYYIEMNPDPTNVCQQMLKFSTDSTNTQPHYSFWFGTPVVEERSANGGTFSLSVRNPNKSSLSTSISVSSGIPQKAWVHTVVVKYLSSSNSSAIWSAILKATMPQATKPLVDRSVPSSGAEVEFIDYTEASGAPARGIYKFQLTNVDWKYNAATNATYTFKGEVVVNYLAAFGA